MGDAANNVNLRECSFLKKRKKRNAQCRILLFHPEVDDESSIGGGLSNGCGTNRGLTVDGFSWRRRENLSFCIHVHGCENIHTYNLTMCTPYILTLRSNAGDDRAVGGLKLRPRSTYGCTSVQVHIKGYPLLTTHLSPPVTQHSLNRLRKQRGARN